jgi:hypothetical protein
MVSAWLMQVSLPSTTNIPRDDVVNTFVFAKVGPAPLPVEAESVFEDFFNAQGTEDRSVASFLSSSISRTRQATIKMFDLEEPEPRLPVWTTGITIGPTTNPQKLPDEVALCLSYKGPVSSGDVPARHRGRIFLGPFNTDAIEPTLAGEPAVPSSDLVTTMLDAGERLWMTLSGIWYVWSRADDEIYELNELWVDLAWDTQRRRGRPALSREIRPLVL